jgi:hypothetical protein
MAPVRNLRVRNTGKTRHPAFPGKLLKLKLHEKYGKWGQAILEKIQRARKALARSQTVT